MRASPFVAALVVVFSLLLSAPMAGADQLGWHSETPVGTLGVPAAVGPVGDIQFWAPNRGVLITQGIEGVSPAGVYAYDGTGWHLYSTVCGGEEGRIAWSGPDEFWTVSSYASPQDGSRGPNEEIGRTLCLFRNGEVFKSFAEPFGSATAYRRMEAAACSEPSDCWFAGEPLAESSPNSGPFHLHWNGSALTAVPSLREPQPQIENLPGTITDLNFLGGSLFEAATEAPFVRHVDPTNPAVFSPAPLPEGAVGPFDLAGDPGQLWAVGPVGAATEEPSVLRNIGAGFEEIRLAEGFGPEFVVKSVASEPNAAAVWVGGVKFNSAFQLVATLRRVSATGAVSEAVTLPGPSEELDGKGGVAAIACPASGQCWMATENGWLFHRGEPLPQDTDPAMHVLITSRPEDNSVRKFVPSGLPEDNSGEKESSSAQGAKVLKPFPESRPRKYIVYDVHQKIIGKRTLELSFKLRARAHVQLRAKFHKSVVAKTPLLTLGKGPHLLHLKLDPKRWPTGLDFQVHPVKKVTK